MQPDDVDLLCVCSVVATSGQFANSFFEQIKAVKWVKLLLVIAISRLLSR
jgi:hypothetical protein